MSSLFATFSSLSAPGGSSSPSSAARSFGANQSSAASALGTGDGNGGGPLLGPVLVSPSSTFAGDGISGGVVSLLVEEVDDLHSEFRGRGIKIDLPPTDQSWGKRKVYVKDMDGNCLRFLQEKR